MTAKELSSALTVVGAFFFLISEFTKDPKERILLSRESKIASALGQAVSILS